MSEKKKILIVGGVAGGASCAARLRRLCEKAEIIMFERNEYISFANCGMPYHIGGIIEDRTRLLVQTPEKMNKRFRIDVRIRSEVLKINRDKKCLVVLDIESGKQYEESYDALVLSPGAAPFLPPVPGVDLPGVISLRNLADMDDIIKTIKEKRPERAVVIGGGFIGLEMAEALRDKNVKVTIVELLDQVMGPADPEMASLIHQELRLNGVELCLGVSANEIHRNGDKLNILLSTGENLECGLIIMSVGVKPESKLAKEAGLKIGARGGIVTDEYMQTSDPDIYAVGDAIEVEDFISSQKIMVPLAGPANRQGRIAANNIFGRKSTYKKTQGTSICKVFNMAIGMTGASEKVLKRDGTKFEKVYVHPATHATYYPGASPITLKLIFDPDNGRILGAQAVGADGVDKRIDVLALAIRAGLTVYDLEDAELCYAPPYGSAKDAINYAGFVAGNFLRGDAKMCHTKEMVNPGSNQMLLDVRTDEEVKGGTIPGAIHIPLDDLRDRMDEIPKDKELLIFCQVGLRGYIGCRILFLNGFKCCNYTGGYKTYLMCTGKLSDLPSPKKEMRDDTGETDDSIQPKKKLKT
jgi:NADPH-dependent 2,4-dienoyl-CoA reductase/sulfur reductase-like enzyme/rhodanese-related sulfurtransferase